MAHHHHQHHQNQQQKHLYELLKDDQEPFILNNYIADVHRRCQLTRTQPKRTKPVTNFARNPCFFANSPAPSSDPRKSSPLYFPKSPIGKPLPTAGTSFRRVPSKTASLLLEAAIRVSHKTQSSSSSSRGGNKKNGKTGAGIFGSLLKRLGNSKKPKKEEVNGGSHKVSVKDILRRDLNGGGSGRDNRRTATKADSSPVRRNAARSGGGRESEPSSAVWSSESNESIDLDLECRSSSSDAGGLSEEEEELEFVTEVVYPYDDTQYLCESPFHFVLERSTSSSSAGRRTPEFSSPVASPIRLKTEGNENNSDVECLKEGQLVQKQGDGEEEKEQSSPVSVLDPPFEDDDDCGEEEEEDDVEDEMEDDEGFDMECSFAFVQRVLGSKNIWTYLYKCVLALFSNWNFCVLGSDALQARLNEEKAKQQLLQKLRRFEKLAELDPVELEKRMLEYDNNDDDDEEASECETTSADADNNCIDQLVMDQLCKTSIQIPQDVLKRLVSDLIGEEEKQGINGEYVTKRVCKRFEAWNEVESNTIEMMVEHDFNRSQDEWRNNGDQVSDIAREIELAIFDLLAEELM
ncbi:hypothetical protein LINGRAHAP2_LOCUS35248 [Linum grandiflorum]